jgi:hypothetical protein
MIPGSITEMEKTLHFKGKMRDENGYILTNSKFPDMKELQIIFIQNGLKMGIYSSRSMDLWRMCRKLRLRKTGC